MLDLRMWLGLLEWGDGATLAVNFRAAALNLCVVYQHGYSNMLIHLGRR